LFIPISQEQEMIVQLTRRDLMKRASGLLAVAAVGGLTGIETEAAEEHQERNRVLVRNPAFATIDRSLQQAVDNGTVAGVVAMGATQRGLIYEGASGHANPQTGTAMTLDTVFWLLSMTKAITATACMQLIEQGRLRLDQPADEILPELKSPQVLDGFDASGQPRLRPARNTITVRHLLTHTSGFTYSIWSENMSRYEKVTGMPDIGYSMNGAFKAPLEFVPRERPFQL
jgi:methyl acetate hydrolase